MRPIKEPNSATLNVDKDSPTSHVELFCDEVKIDEGVFNCLYISRSQDENKSIVYIRNRKKGFPSEISRPQASYFAREWEKVAICLALSQGFPMEGKA